MSFETQLQARSEGIASHLLAKKLATQAEIDACGADAELAAADPETALIVRYGDLRALLSERVPDADQRADRRKLADRIILDALRGAPQTVTLADPIGDVRQMNVYPKSLNALVELAERDAVIGMMNTAVAALRDEIARTARPDHVDALARAIREVAHQQQVCAWIVTHSAPGLPFPIDATRPEVPAALAALSPVDLLLIFEAHQNVNAGRLAALQSLPRGKKKGEDERGRGWGVFLAGMASDTRSAEQLARDYSLPALFAQNYVNAVEQERMMAKAEA